MLDRMNFLRAWSIDGRRISATSHNPRRALPSIAKDYPARRHRQNFTAAPVSRGLCRHGDAALREFSPTIEALRRKLRQPASSAVMISVMRSARGKIHGIARAVHNSEKRARYNLAHRAVSGFSAISELAHSLHQTEHGLFRVPSKKKKRDSRLL